MRAVYTNMRYELKGNAWKVGAITRNACLYTINSLRVGVTRNECKAMRAVYTNMRYELKGNAWNTRNACLYTINSLRYELRLEWHSRSDTQRVSFYTNSVIVGVIVGVSIKFTIEFWSDAAWWNVHHAAVQRSLQSTRFHVYFHVTTICIWCYHYVYSVTIICIVLPVLVQCYE